MTELEHDRSSNGALPLAQHERFRTHDLEQARDLVAQTFCAHELSPLDRRGRVDARFHSVRLGQVGLNYIDYGTSVRISPDPLQDFFLVMLPLAGRAEVSCDDEVVVANTSVAAILAPDREVVMRWGEGNRQLVVWIDRWALETHLSKMLGKPLAQRLRFDLGAKMPNPAFRSWRNVVELLRLEVESGGWIPDEQIPMTELQRLLFSQLLLAQPHNYFGALHRDPSKSPPKVIRFAVELINAHAAEPLTVEDIAEAVGVSERSLQDGFRRFLGTTPMNYVREVRLRSVRAELESADPTRTNVTDTALRWGFLHLGRFSVQYRERFGESPSDTLRG